MEHKVTTETLTVTTKTRPKEHELTNNLREQKRGRTNLNLNELQTLAELLRREKESKEGTVFTK